MGQYTIYDIQIECEKETVAEAVMEAFQNFKKMVRKHVLKNNESFHVNITNIENFEGQVDITLSSDNSKNAEWQVNAIIKILQEERIYPSNFSADKNMRAEFSLDVEGFYKFDTGL